MPITANLMVTDMARSLAFWRDLLGFEVKMAVDANRGMTTDAEGAVFVVLHWDGTDLMLQEATSIRGELPGVLAEGALVPVSALYLRDHDPHGILARVDPERVVKGPVAQWYGMTEVYVRDPDGHLVCIAAAEGPPPG